MNKKTYDFRQDPLCPNCGSDKTEQKPYVELGVMTLFIIIGTAISILEHPGSLRPMISLSSVERVTSAALYWAEQGRRLGQQIDATLISKYACSACGSQFFA